jgi:hypothetical protein
MIFLGVVELCRALGARTTVGAIVAVAAALSRPIISQSFEVKDDLFAAAFFLAAVNACASAKLTDRLGPWRVGVAVGLFAATKYTALLSAPILLLLIDAAFRARWDWRRWLAAIACALALAGPWYLRNWIVAGNPIYPVPLDGLPGLFVTRRATELSTWRGVWLSLTDTPPAPGLEGKFHSPSATLMIVLCIGWLAALAITLIRRRPRSLFTDPLLRTTLIGPPIGFAIYVLASHAGEIRYLYPSLMLLFACCAVALDAALFTEPACAGVALLLAALSAWGSFNNKSFVGWFSVDGALTALLGCALGYFAVPWLRAHRRARLAVACVCALTLAGFVYVYWPGYLKALRLNFTDPHVTSMKGPRADLWHWFDENIPPDARVAYTNDYMIRPLQGFDYGRTLAYAPTRPGVHAYHDLPPSRTPLTDQQIRVWCAAELTANADRTTWLDNLDRIKPQYLLMGKQDVLASPPERAFADDDPARFTKIYEDDAGAIYRLTPGR